MHSIYDWFRQHRFAVDFVLMSVLWLVATPLSAIDGGYSGSTSDTVLAVLNGKADVLVETNVAAAYMVTQNAGKLEMAGQVFDPDTTFGVFSKKGSTMTPAIATAFKALKDDGSLGKIAQKYNLDTSILEVK